MLITKFKPGVYYLVGISTEYDDPLEGFLMQEVYSFGITITIDKEGKVESTYPGIDTYFSGIRFNITGLFSDQNTLCLEKQYAKFKQDDDIPKHSIQLLLKNLTGGGFYGTYSLGEENARENYLRDRDQGMTKLSEKEFIREYLFRNHGSVFCSIVPFTK